MLVPSAFTWPNAYLRDSPVRPALCYPAHGFGSLWARSDPPTHDAPARLVGHARARLLCELERPGTVTEPATRLGVTAGAVSQHPGVLRAAGLAVSRRDGREVVSLRTGLGPALVRGEVPWCPVGVVLSEAEWTARRDAHAARVRRWTGPHHERKAAGHKHPVLDFLFSYYSHRPSRLERWHPGPGVVLEGDAALAYLKWPVYRRTPDGVALDVAAFARERANTIGFTGRLLAATASRPPRLGCFGLHEWAMVYRQRPDQVRHNAWPLRLGGEGTDRVVESQRVQCGHFDAFRFFTPEARPRNTLQPTRETQAELEQPGCLHANMDLFKWAYKLDPATPSELVADCFELAVRIRELDMRASPYDLAGLGYEPVPIETAEGRAEYVRQQSAFAEAARPLRARLVELTRLLGAESEAPVAAR